MSYTYEYPHPAVTADIVIYSIRNEELHVLLIQRKLNPFAGAWALPGGFIQMEEDLEAGAARELAEETGLTGIHLEQLGAFGRPDRDPRERVITIAFLALVPSDKLVLNAATDASDAQWHNLSDLPKLAFDHDNILNAGRERLATMVSSDIVQSARVVFEFLPEKFTLAQAQSVFEIIKGEALDKRNFRKWIMANWALTDLEEKTQGGRHRPAALYALT